MTIETAEQIANRLRTDALNPDADRVTMLDAADTIEELTDQLRTLADTRDHLEAIISNLRAKLHHLQMVDSGE
jgi:cell division protein FtsB